MKDWNTRPQIVRDPFQRIGNPCHLVYRLRMNWCSRSTSARVTPARFRSEFTQHEFMMG